MKIRVIDIGKVIDQTPQGLSPGNADSANLRVLAQMRLHVGSRRPADPAFDFRSRQTDRINHHCILESKALF